MENKYKLLEWVVFSIPEYPLIRWEVVWIKYIEYCSIPAYDVLSKEKWLYTDILESWLQSSEYYDKEIYLYKNWI